jgi:hypothetical protein
MKPEHHPDRKAGECQRVAFAHAGRIAELHGGQWFASDLQQRQIVLLVDGQEFGVARLRLAVFRNQHDRSFFFVSFQWLGNDVGVGDYVATNWTDGLRVFREVPTPTTEGLMRSMICASSALQADVAHNARLATTQSSHALARCAAYIAPIEVKCLRERVPVVRTR